MIGEALEAQSLDSLTDTERGEIRIALKDHMEYLEGKKLTAFQRTLDRVGSTR